MADSLYRVRKSWADSATQLGAYGVLASAITLAQANPPYNVYDGNGVEVWSHVVVQYGSKDVVADFGAVGNADYLNPADGKYYANAAFTILPTDDSTAFMQAIKFCWENTATIRTLNVPKRNYLIDGEIVIYGNDLVMNGNGATLIRNRSYGGVFGGVFHIYGQKPGLTYPGGVGTFATSKCAKRIYVNDFNMKFNTKLGYATINGFGMVHAEDCHFVRCTCDYAQQTAFTLVGLTEASTGLIMAINNCSCEDCTSTNCLRHSFRQTAILTGLYHTSTLLRCIAKTTLQADTHYNMGQGPTLSDVPGRFVHLLCGVSDSRAGTFSMKSIGCNFDASGMVFCSGYAKNVVITSSTVSYPGKYQRVQNAAIPTFN